MLTKVMIIACIGLMLCLYSYTVEQKIKQDQSYKPFCNLSDRISCSKPIQSSYGALFGVSNSLVGIFFYLAILILAALNMKTTIVAAAFAACCASIVFAFILAFKVKAFCLICVSIYLVNALLLWASLRL